MRRYCHPSNADKLYFTINTPLTLIVYFILFWHFIDINNLISSLLLLLFYRHKIVINMYVFYTYLFLYTKAYRTKFQ